MSDARDMNSSPKLLRRLTAGIAAFVAFIFIVLFIFPFILPHSYEKASIERVLGYLTGLPVKIMGDASFSILPSIQITASKLVVPSLQALDGGDGSVLLDIESIDLKVATFALLVDEIDIQKLYIDAPQFRFVRNRDGVSNWGAEGQATGKRIEPDLDWGWWNDMQIEEVGVSNGRIFFSDEAQGINVEGTDLNLKAFTSNATGAGKGASISGSANVNSEPVSIQIDIGAVDKLLAGGRLPVIANLSSAFAMLSYQGAIAKRQYLVSDGRFKLEAPSISQLEGWLGQLFDVPMAGSLLISGRLNENGSRVAFDDLSFLAGESQATGRALFTNSANGRRIDAEFSSPFFHLDPFVTMATSSSWIKYMQGSIKAKWSSLAAAGVTSGPGELAITMRQAPRRIDLTMPEIGLFGGLGRAEIQVGMGEGMTSVKGQLELSRFQPEALLKNFDSRTTVSGSGDLRLNLFSVGGSPDELLQALRGTGDFNILAGRFHHEILAEYLLKGSPGHLDFIQLIGSFSVNQGIVEGSDLLLKAPSLSLVGDGIVDLAEGVVDIQLQSLITNTNSGDTDDIQVQPFRIYGTLDELEIHPED